MDQDNTAISLAPECELEIKLKYQQCLACNRKKQCKFAKAIIAFWDAYTADQNYEKYRKEWEGG